MHYPGVQLTPHPPAARPIRIKATRSSRRAARAGAQHALHQPVQLAHLLRRQPGERDGPPAAAFGARAQAGREARVPVALRRRVLCRRGGEAQRSRGVSLSHTRVRQHGSAERRPRGCSLGLGPRTRSGAREQAARCGDATLEASNTAEGLSAFEHSCSRAACRPHLQVAFWREGVEPFGADCVARVARLDAAAAQAVAECDVARIRLRRAARRARRGGQHVERRSVEHVPGGCRVEGAAHVAVERKAAAARGGGACTAAGRSVAAAGYSGGCGSGARRGRR
eukprot:1039600-Prymnesium_polylepis.1